MRRSRATPLRVLLTFALALAVGWPLTAQWSNRYPRIEGFSHHVYVEGYDFPTVAAGPTYPGASLDGRHLAFSAHGWIWVLELGEDGARGVARRVTSGAGLDSCPAWAPGGGRLPFVRDDTRDTVIGVIAGMESAGRCLFGSQYGEPIVNPKQLHRRRLRDGRIMGRRDSSEEASRVVWAQSTGGSSALAHKTHNP